MSSLKNSITEMQSRLAALQEFVARFEDDFEVPLENATEEVTVIFRPGKLNMAVARIDGVRITFDDNGKGNLMVEPGRHALTWNIFGQPGQSYEIRITAPSSAKCEVPQNPTIGDDKKAYGYCEFTI